MNAEDDKNKLFAEAYRLMEEERRRKLEAAWPGEALDMWVGDRLLAASATMKREGSNPRRK